MLETTDDKINTLSTSDPKPTGADSPPGASKPDTFVATAAVDTPTVSKDSLAYYMSSHFNEFVLLGHIIRLHGLNQYLQKKITTVNELEKNYGDILACIHELNMDSKITINDLKTVVYSLKQMFFTVVDNHSLAETRTLANECNNAIHSYFSDSSTTAMDNTSDDLVQDPKLKECLSRISDWKETCLPKLQRMYALVRSLLKALPADAYYTELVHTKPVCRAFYDASNKEDSFRSYPETLFDDATPDKTAKPDPTIANPWVIPMNITSDKQFSGSINESPSRWCYLRSLDVGSWRECVDKMLTDSARKLRDLPKSWQDCVVADDSKFAIKQTNKFLDKLLRKQDSRYDVRCSNSQYRDISFIALCLYLLSYYKKQLNEETIAGLIRQLRYRLIRRSYPTANNTHSAIFDNLTCETREEPQFENLILPHMSGLAAIWFTCHHYLTRKTINIDTLADRENICLFEYTTQIFALLGRPVHKDIQEYILYTKAMHFLNEHGANPRRFYLQYHTMNVANRLAPSCDRFIDEPQSANQRQSLLKNYYPCFQRISKEKSLVLATLSNNMTYLCTNLRWYKRIFDTAHIPAIIPSPYSYSNRDSNGKLIRIPICLNTMRPYYSNTKGKHWHQSAKDLFGVKVSQLIPGFKLFVDYVKKYNKYPASEQLYEAITSPIASVNLGFFPINEIRNKRIVFPKNLLDVCKSVVLSYRKALRTVMAELKKEGLQRITKTKKVFLPVKDFLKIIKISKDPKFRCAMELEPFNPTKLHEIINETTSKTKSQVESFDMWKPHVLRVRRAKHLESLRICETSKTPATTSLFSWFTTITNWFSRLFK